MNELDDLYANDIYSEKLLMKNGNYNAAHSALCDISRRLNELLPESEREITEELMMCIREIEYQGGKTMFAAGFSMGKRYADEINEEKY